MEIEVRHGIVLEILRAGELERVAGDREHDLAAFAAVDLLGLAGAERAQHGGDAALELGQVLLGILWGLRDLRAGQTGNALLGEAAGDLSITLEIAVSWR
jgi:hypothetical protein